MRDNTTLRRLLLFVVAVGLVFALSVPAQAFTIRGGTQTQQTCIKEVINSCPLPSRLIEVTLGPIDVYLEDFGETPIVGWAKPGEVHIDSELTGLILESVMQHEWAHEIWFSLDTDRHAYYRDLCDPLMKSAGVDPSNGRLSVRENFAECARAALWGLGDFPIYTDLSIVDPFWLRWWLT